MAMKWLQVSVSVDAELAEAVADVLSRFAPGGVAIELPQGADMAASSEVAVKAYLAMDASTDQVRRQIEESLWHLSQISPFPDPIFSVLEEQDWAAAWKDEKSEGCSMADSSAARSAISSGSISGRICLM